MSMAKVLAEGMPGRLEWLINKSEVRREMGEPPVSLEASLFNYDLRYIRS